MESMYRFSNLKLYIATSFLQLTLHLTFNSRIVCCCIKLPSLTSILLPEMYLVSYWIIIDVWFFPLSYLHTFFSFFSIFFFQGCGISIISYSDPALLIPIQIHCQTILLTKLIRLDIPLFLTYLVLTRLLKLT